MQENAIMTLLSQFVAFVLIVAITSVGIFSYVLSTTTSFKQYINYEIERNGGLTNDSLYNIHEYYRRGGYKFNYEFVNMPDEEERKLSYGDKVDYELKISIKPIFFTDQTVVLTERGTATSRVRGQAYNFKVDKRTMDLNSKEVLANVWK